MIYVLNVIYNIYLATYFAASDIFFVSCGLSLVGATQEVEDFLVKLDEEIEGITAESENNRYADSVCVQYVTYE